MIAAALFVMWEECFRRALHNMIAPVPGEGLSSRAEVFFWVGRELVWWWLVVGLAALVLSYLRQSPIPRVTFSALAELRNALEHGGVSARDGPPDSSQIISLSASPDPRA
jgi:hypothetical protein